MQTDRNDIEQNLIAYENGEFVWKADEKSEALLENFSGASAFFVYDRDSKNVRLLHVTKAYQNELTTRKNTEEILQINPWSQHDEAGRKAYEEKIEEAIRTGLVVSCDTWRREFSTCCGDDYVCIRSHLHWVRTEGKTHLLYATIENITNDKKELEEISDSENKFRWAAEQANVYAWEYTVATKEMRPCVRCMRDLGLPPLVTHYPEPVIEKGIFPQDYADMYRKWHQNVAEGVPYQEGIIPLTPDRIPFHVRYTTEFDNNGKPVKAYGSATMVVDLNKQKEFHEIIDTLSQGFTNVYKTDIDSDDAMAIKLEGFVPKCIKICETGTLFSYSEKMGGYIAERVHPDDKAMMIAAVKKENVVRNLADQSQYSIIYRVVDRGTEAIHYFQVMFFKLKEKPTIIVGFQNVDAMVAKQMETERTLQEALTQARHASAAKSSFLSRMSHDIRTPLNGIIGLLEMEEHHPDDRALAMDCRSKMRIAADHLLALINDVLDLSKMEDEKTVLVKEPFDMEKICSDAIAIAEMKAGEDGIQVIREKLGEKLTGEGWNQGFPYPYVYGSPLYVKRILLNILNNSIKYNKPNGSVFYSVACRKDADTLYYRYEIRDTGIGMSKEYLAKIFEPFSQEHSDARSVYKGTGLGMSIAKSLIEKMGGSIDVTSTPDVGSDFVIIIPYEEAPKNEVQVTEIPEEEISIKGIRILMAEDNAINTMVARSLLKDAGAKMVCVKDGQKAVETITAAPAGTFDIVLMDVMMPVMGGLDATRAIRNSDREDLKKIPIIALTANAFADDITACKEAGMDAHISKPMRLKEALKTISLFMK